MDFQLYNRIQALIERDKLDLALERINAGLTEYPDSDDLYSLLATVYMKQKNYKQAQQAVNTGVGLNPENDYLYYQDARLAIEKDEYLRAEKSIDEAIGLNPYQAGYFGLKAALYIDLKKYEEAIEYALDGLDLDPENTMCNNMLSMAQTKSGQANEAFNRLENMLANNPESELTQANTGYFYLRQGNIAKAKEHFAVALNSDPEFEFARSGMIQAIKASNFFYRKLLQFSFWFEEKSSQYRWALYIGIFILIKLVPILVPVYLVLVLWTWFTGPISDVILYLDQYGRYLMTPLSRKLTQVNITLLILALASLIVGLLINSAFLVLAFACLLSVIPVFLFKDIVKTSKRIALGVFGFLFLAAGLLAVCQVYIFHQNFSLSITLLMASAVIFTWIVAALKA